MKTRGQGFVYQPVKSKTVLADGTVETEYWAVWWISYTDTARGKRIRESSRSTNRSEAVRLLKARNGDVVAGRPTGPDTTRTTLDDLLRGLLDDYKMRKRRSIKRIADAAKHLRAHFGEQTRAASLTSSRIKAYVVARQEQGAAAATINRELAALKKAFRLALKDGRVATMPIIELLPEENARQGFLTHDEFLRLHEALPTDLRDPVMFLYLSAWRVGEMRSLQWRDVRLSDGLIILRSENSKNKRPRTLPLRGDLRAIVERAAQSRRLDCPFVFLRSDGAPVGSFRKAWASACRISGLGNVLVHDLRRCGVRNLIRSGVDQKTAMMISGHKTISTFNRYNIVDDEDLARAMDRVSAHLAAQPQLPAKVIPIDHQRPQSVKDLSKTGAVG